MDAIAIILVKLEVAYILGYLMGFKSKYNQKEKLNVLSLDFLLFISDSTLLLHCGRKGMLLCLCYKSILKPQALPSRTSSDASITYKQI